MATLDELRAAVADVDEQMRSLHEEIGTEVPTEEQEARWAELTKDHEAAKKDLAEGEARAKRLAESRAKYQSQQVSVKTDPWDQDMRTASAADIYSRAMSVVDSADTGRHLRADQKERVQKLLRTQNSDTDGELLGRYLLATENPHYRSAFQKVAASVAPVFTPEEGRAVEQARMIKRAMSVGTDGQGGFAVPSLIDPTIIMTAQGSPNDLLRLARVETITNDTWRGLTSAGVTWQFHAEAAQATDNSPTIGQPEVPTHRADGFIPFSIEIGMDWPGFAEQMSMMLGEGYDELLADKLTTSTGANDEPWGLVGRLAATTSPVIKLTVTTHGTIAPGNIYDLWADLPVRYRNAASCAWMSSTDVQNAIRQLGGDQDPNFSVNITQERIPSMFGREYPMNDYMADVPAVTNSDTLLVLGDFRNFLVAQRAGMTVEFLPQLFGANQRPTGQRGWFAWARVGSDVVNANGFRILANNATT